MLNTMTRTALLLTLAVSITACGFHLRGNIPLDEGIKNMFVLAPEGTFKDQLERIVSKAGAEVAGARSAADVVLNVSNASVKRTVGTLDERGKANSYNLVFSVTYSLDGLDGEKVRKVTSLTESRRYNFDPERVVESEAEEAELLESMEEEASLRIVRQLSTITGYQPGKPRESGDNNPGK